MATLALVIAAFALLVASAGNIVVFGNTRAELVENQRERDTLCRNQHSMIGMQRLFLAEHAAIRVQLMEAGIPNEHADPELLEELERLIDAADCDVSTIEKG